MDEKWITLAVRTFERAQKIKVILDECGIETVIHNLNLENPELAVGVRVRIKEKDLPKALEIVEEKEKAWEEENTTKLPFKGKKILIPVDLTDQINEKCKFGFEFAKKLKCEVVFLHAYLTPAYTITTTTNTDINTYSLTDAETMRRMIRTLNADVENLTNLINRWIEKGDIPKVKFSFVLRSGVPEDEILSYCKKESPILVIMGNKSKKQDKDGFLVGSVTSEVLEASSVPVMTVSSEAKITPEKIKRVAFFTNFDQKDLIAIDKAISLLKNDNLEFVFLHATNKKESWDEVMLAGIKVYFSNHYPNLKTEYAFLKTNDNLDKIQPFLTKSKIDLVALNTKKRSIFARLFNQGIATKLLLNVDTPLLVMHV